MKNLFGLCNKLLEWVIVVCTAGFVILCFLQVVFRFVFNNSIPWSEEACRFLFVFVVFLGGIVCVREKRHTNIDLIVIALPVRLRKLYMFGVYALMCLFSLILMYAGWNLAIKNMYQVSSALRIPLGVIYLVIPVSGLFMAINSVAVGIKDFIAEKKTGEAK